MTDNATPQDASRARSRRGLGRGLNALLGSRPETDSEGAADTPVSQTPSENDQIDVELIERNPFQPRVDFDADTMQELVASVRKHGILLPLLVRPHDSGYQLIAGERRLRAARKAGLKTVPCRVLELDDKRVCEAAIEENLKRKDLNVLEKAHAFQDYMEKFESTVEELAKQLSLNRSTVSNLIRLLELSEPAKEALRQDQISAGHARAILSLNADDQKAMCERISTESLSVRQTEKAVRDLQNEGQPTISMEKAREAKASEGSESGKPPVSNHILSLQDQLREMLGAKVEIRLNGKESGRIMIDFQSNSDFARIIRQIRRAA